MPLRYSLIRVLASEEERVKGQPLANAIVEYVRNLRIGARCMVFRASAGCYEDGEIASRTVELLMFNMPVTIEVLLPESEVPEVVAVLERMVADGVILVENRLDIRSYRTRKRFLPRDIRVKDVMTRSPVSVRESAPLREIIHLLVTADLKSLSVVDRENRPLGIITQGDLVTRAGLPIRLGLLRDIEEGGLAGFFEIADKLFAKDVMTTPAVVTDEEAFLREAIDRMLELRLKRLPVVDKSHQLVGMLARIDIFGLVSTLASGWETLATQNVSVENIVHVRDIMEREVHPVKASASIAEVLETMRKNRILRVPVVGEDGRLIGIIVDRDLLKVFAGHEVGVWSFLLSRLPFTDLAKSHKEALAVAHAKTASDLMKSVIVTIQEESPIDAAITVMVAHALKRVPVVDEAGGFKGMISRDAVLRAGLQHLS
jgi:CBS domain-containing protein/PII-like signaling protein